VINRHTYQGLAEAVVRTVEQHFEDYRIGERRDSIGRTITESDIVLHAGQTGDWFPHHVDAHWCAGQEFGQRIAHGTLILSVAVGMTASDINPQSMSYGYDKVRFIGPVFIGDTIRVTAEITEKSEHPKRPDAVGFVSELVTVVNQRSETVMVLTHLYLVNRRAA
jgi:acyl dehydratase